MTRSQAFCVAMVLCGPLIGIRPANPAPAAEPDVVLHGGRIFTADPSHPWAQAISVRGERILAVGSDAVIRPTAGPRTRVIDLAGRVVIPGINDTHDHLGLAPIGVNFRTDSSPTPDPPLDGLLQSLRGAVAHAPAGTWLQAVIGPTLVSLARTPALRAALDRAAPNHPVLLSAWWGHGIIFNSAGLRVLNVREQDPDPLGGHYERDERGRLTGWLQEYAGWSAIRRLNSALPLRMLVANLQQQVADRVRYGVTSIQDIAGYMDPVTTVRVFRAAQLPIRVRIVPWPMPDATNLRASEWDGADQHPSPLTVISGVKWVIDGTPIEELALQNHAYPGRPGWRGRLDFPMTAMRAMLTHALRGDQQPLFHVVGDGATSAVLSLMEQLAPADQWRGRRVRIEHGSGITGAMVERARRLGIVISQPRVEAASPFRTWQRAGIPLAYGSDNSPNPFFDLMLVVTSPGDPSEALSREEAVTMFTRGSAYAEFQEEQKGTLAPGMLADLAVLSQDIFSVPVKALPATTSLLTMVGGKVVYEASSSEKAQGRRDTDRRASRLHSRSEAAAAEPGH